MARASILSFVLCMVLQFPVGSVADQFSKTPECRIHVSHHNITHLKNRLQQQVKGVVVSPWDWKYEEYRAIHNPACCHRPLLIVRPWGDKDVSRVVQFSVRLALQLSVRSGGHSYTCTSLKDGGIHLDLRTLNKVELVKTRRSKTGLAAVLGPGSTWGRVLDIIPPDVYTMVHGQCLTVGVGGYLLGGGTNALGASAKYGFAVHNIIEMRIVLADGSIARVNEKKVDIWRVGGQREVLPLTEENDLWFALRGAGTSFGVVTEFLYTVHDEPETLPILIPVMVESAQDIAAMERAALQTKKWLFSAYSAKRYFPGIFPFNLLPYDLPYSKKMSGAALLLLQKVTGIFSRAVASPGASPTFITVTQVRGSAGRHTDPVPAINYLKAHGVRIALDNPIVINLISKTLGYLVLNSYESPLLTPQEQRIVGNLNISPAVNWAGTSSKDYSEAFLYHPLLGQNTPYSNDEVHSITGCDFCGFTFYFDNHLRFFDYSRVAINPLLGSFMWDMSCLFLRPDSKCPSVVREFKEVMSRPSVPRVSEWQYSNTPSCEPTPFGDRYWGSHYPRLLQLKQMWDPKDVFHHCHSVGSHDQNCCPY